MDVIPSLPVDVWIAAGVNWIEDTLGAFFDFISFVLEFLYGWLETLLLAPPSIALVLVGGALAWLVRGWKFAIFALLGLALIDAMGQWEPSMSTLALVIVAAVMAIVLSVPLGIVAARSNTVSAIFRPVLDFMQTLHPFVYLVPAVILFGVGVEPGIIATIIFGMPPGVRFTELGIRQVDKEVVEAGDAFGAHPRQILARIQIPLALPTIMGGINQVIMLSLSMVVLAGIVGAGGLGAIIISAISRLEVGLGFEGGIAVVVLAILLDRLTGAVGRRAQKRREAAA